MKLPYSPVPSDRGETATLHCDLLQTCSGVTHHSNPHFTLGENNINRSFDILIFAVRVGKGNKGIYLFPALVFYVTV